MKRLAVAAVLLVLAGCGTGGGGASSADTRTEVHGDGPYAVGADIEPGVWTTSGHEPCGGFTARSRTFDVTSADDPDAFIAGSVRVGDLQRIVLHRGEYFFSDRCAEWARVDSPERTTDPATTEGGCAILVGDDDLVQETLDFGHLPAGKRDERTGSELQDRLFTLVVSRTKQLDDAAGQLVDYRDDPDAYNVGAGTDEKVTRAVDRIRAVCAKH